MNSIPNPDDQQAKVSVYVNSKLVFSAYFNTTLEFGRQRQNEPAPYWHSNKRVVVAEISESEISRRHVMVELLEGNRIGVRNVSAVNDVLFGTADPIAPKSNREFELPTILTIGDRVLEFELETAQDDDDGAIVDSFSHTPTPPGQPSKIFESSIHDRFLESSESETKFLLRGLHLATSAFGQAESNDDYYVSACEGIINLVALETAAVLIWKDDQWAVECYRTRTGETAPSPAWVPSYSVLENVRTDKRTFWKVPRATRNNTPSLIDVKALVAAPLLDSGGNVIGALYGDRRHRFDGKMNMGLTEVEASLVEVLASGIATGLERLKYRKDATEARVLFEQFFTPELSRELEKSPDLLVGKDVEVSLLFCEIRGFSELSEKLGTRLTLDWINDVMGTLSDCVTESNGTLVDMMGDEIVAMWGAPLERSDHANLACQAAVRMFENLPALNRRWQQAMDRPMDIGIGVHTGIARVGNIGSKHKFKYGPLGSTVRVAIRAQRSTGEFGAKILITSDTKDQLIDDFSIRQLGKLVDKQAELTFQMYEVMPTPPTDWEELKRRYETAVSAFEKQDAPTAISLLGKVLADHPGDRPSLQLMSRINEQLTPKPWSL